MARYWFCTPRSNLDSWRFNQGREIVALAYSTGVTCAGDTPRAHWAGGERLLKNLFAAELPEELFRKVITFWAPVWK